MADPIDPATDCPPCPRCSAPVGTPIRESQRRLTGPPSANLFCPACGCCWVAGAAALAQAEKSLAAYHVKLSAEAKEPR